MDTIAKAYKSLTDFLLWCKVESGETLNISDVPLLLKSRYQYLLDNWMSIRDSVSSRGKDYGDYARFQVEFDNFNKLVEIEMHRKDGNKTNENDLIASYFTIFDNIFISDIPISQGENKIIKSEMDRVSSFTKNTFIKMREDFIAGRDAISDNIGGTDDTYNSIYKRSPLIKILDKSISQLSSSYQFEIAISAINNILANEMSLTNEAGVDPFAFAKSNANNPEINIQSYSSGNLVKLNYGETLQTLALRTMDDETKWVEIAIANGLKPPYIDEIGENVKLLTNAKGNSINIGKVDVNGKSNKEKLYINQIVTLRSNPVGDKPIIDQRTIVSIKEIPVSGELVIELNGDPDLNKYQTIDNAYITIYKPHTVNSNFYILIPSSDPVDKNLKPEEPWFLKSKGEDEKKAGIDIRLDEYGDISFTQAGDLQLSYGLENAIQSTKILLSTEAGNLSKHSDYGISAPIGDKNLSPEQMRSAIATNVSDQVLNDARFSRLDFLSVESLSETNESGYIVKLGVVLSGGDTVIPISFKVNAF